MVRKKYLEIKSGIFQTRPSKYNSEYIYDWLEQQLSTNVMLVFPTLWTSFAILLWNEQTIIKTTKFYN